MYPGDDDNMLGRVHRIPYDSRVHGWWSINVPRVPEKEASARLTAGERGRSSGHDVNLKHRIGGGNVSLRHAEFATHDVAALGDCAGLIERDLAIAALAPKAAVARDDELLGGDDFQGLTN